MCTQKNVAERRWWGPCLLNDSKAADHKKNLGWDRCVYSWLINLPEFEITMVSINYSSLFLALQNAMNNSFLSVPLIIQMSQLPF